MQGRSAGCPAERKPSPRGARKNHALGNDKGATARVVLEALAILDLDPGVLNRIRSQLDPLPPPKPYKRLEDLEVKIDKAQQDAAANASQQHQHKGRTVASDRETNTTPTNQHSLTHCEQITNGISTKHRYICFISFSGTSWTSRHVLGGAQVLLQYLARITF